MRELVGRYKHGDSDLNFARALKLWRFAIGWTIKKTALELDVSPAMLRTIERGETLPTIQLIEKFRQSQIIDLYMLAYCESADTSKLMPRVQAAVAELKEAMREAVSIHHSVKHTLPSGWW